MKVSGDVDSDRQSGDLFLRAVAQRRSLLQKCHAEPGSYVIDLPVEGSPNDRVLYREIKQRNVAPAMVKEERCNRLTPSI